MAQPLNTTPYFDDFDPLKNYHQILFKPGLPVQARELTQSQTILRNQIAQFGNHVFRQGSLVIPGNSFSELIVPFVKVTSTYNGSVVDFSLFEGRIVVGDSSGVKAFVKKYVAATDTDPATLYLSYTSGGTTGGVPNGKLAFDSNEIIRIESIPTIATYSQTSGATGTGSMAFVNAGVYYVNGTFVSTPKQSIVISKYNSIPHCHVLFKINQVIVDNSEDETLLDPAQGSYNFAAPGADRLKLSLELTTLPLGSALTEDYVELMRYDNGELLEHFNTPKYSEFEKSLAQRTYDESGDYVVNGLKVSVREHKKDGVNGGLFVDGDYGKFSYELTAGKAYVRGLAVENLAGKRSIQDKARTLPHVMQDKVTIKPSWGQFLMVSDPRGALDIQSRETIQLWDTSDVSGGNQLGTAKVLGLDYLVGDGSLHPIYKLYITDLVLTTGSYDDIGSVRMASANFVSKVVGEYSAPVTAGAFVAGDVITFNGTDRVATVSFYDTVSGMLYAHKHSATTAPKAGDTVVGPNATSTIQSKTMIGKTGSGSLVFSLPNRATKALKDATNTYDMEFTNWVVLSIPSGGTTASVSSGTLVPIETGTFIALTNTGVDTNSLYSMGSGGTTVNRTTAAPAGGVTIYCQVQKNDAIPRIKTITTHSGAYAAGNSVMLSHADVYQIDTIILDGVDVTSRFSLNNGQTDSEYGISSLSLKNGFTTPTGSMLVTYKYFSHSAGDFFSVDSYPSSLDNDLIPSYRSSYTGRTYSLRDSIDFRKTVGMSSSAVVPDTFITTSVQKYVPRIDVVCIDKQGAMVVVNGTPSDNPKAPVVPTTLYALAHAFVPAYTYRLNTIRFKRVAITRYTMEKVASLESRILNVEQYSMLSAAESDVTNTPFIDAATGLDRFKTGYLVESMANPFQVASASSEGFTASLNARFGITAKMEEDIVPVAPIDTGIGVVNTNTVGLISQTTPLFTGSGLFNTNGVITLPYYDKVFASVGVSSKITSVNPFSVIGFNGAMTLVPNGDVWVDVLDRPEIVNNVTNTVTTTIWVSVPRTPPTPAPAVPTIPTNWTTPAFTIGPVPAPVPVFETNNIAPLFVETPVVVGPAPAPAPVAEPVGGFGPGTSDTSFPVTEPANQWSWYDNGMTVTDGEGGTFTVGDNGNWDSGSGMEGFNSTDAFAGGADPGGDGGYDGFYGGGSDGGD